MARYPQGRERSAMLPLLYLVQSVEGWVTREGLREVAALLGLTTAEVEAVATLLHDDPPAADGRARGDRLHEPVLRAPRREGGATRRRTRPPASRTARSCRDDGVITLHEEECLGACDAAPVVQVDFANHDGVTPERDARADRVAAPRRGPAPSRGEPMRDFREASRVLAGLEVDA